MNYNGYNSDKSEQNFYNPIKSLGLHGVPILNQRNENNCYISVIIHILYNVPEIKAFLLSENFPQNRNFELLLQLKVSFK